VNPFAANHGDVVKHLLLCEVLAAKPEVPLSYVDAYAGRPFNRISDQSFLFARRRADRGWADSFMRAVDRSGGDLARSEYATALRRRHSGGEFWTADGLAPDPLYPGSVGFAWLLRSQTTVAWMCAERDEADQRLLEELLGQEAVVSDLVGDDLRWRCLDPPAGHRQVVLVDPFNLARRTPEAERDGRFALEAAHRGSQVLAWYPIGRCFEQAVVDQLAVSTPQATVFVVRWPPEPDSSLEGCGLLTWNLGAELIGRLERLLASLDSLAY